MGVARLYVDFNEMIEEDLVSLSNEDFMKNTEGKFIHLREGLSVKLFSDDLNSCSNKDNLIAEGKAELNTHPMFKHDIKWVCRINKKGIYNASQKT